MAAYLVVVAETPLKSGATGEKIRMTSDPIFVRGEADRLLAAWRSAVESPDWKFGIETRPFDL